jgi:N4-gp56 family major capsid protein
MVDTLGTLTIEAKQYYEMDMLYRARQAQVFMEFSLVTTFGDNQGNSVSWRRVNAYAVNSTALVEGTTPTQTSISLTEVSGTAAQYGAFSEISDMLQKLGIDKLMNELTPALAQNAGESIETVIANVIQAGTVVLYATGSARASQGTGNPLTLALLRKALSTLDAAKTHRFSGPEENDKVGQGNYIAFVHPYVVYDIFNDSEVKNAFQYAGAGTMFKSFYDGSIGSLYGIELMQSTLTPIFAGAGSAGANVYGTIVVGQQAYGTVDIGGSGKYQMIVKPLGSAGADDPLDQRSTVGWKGFQLPIILNNAFMVRIETGATIG